jgi:hypothetical protein
MTLSPKAGHSQKGLRASGGGTSQGSKDQGLSSPGVVGEEDPGSSRESLTLALNEQRPPPQEGEPGSEPQGPSLTPPHHDADTTPAVDATAKAGATNSLPSMERALPAGEMGGLNHRSVDSLATSL